MMENFELALRKKFIQDLSNSFFNNHDELRFGGEKTKFLLKLKSALFRNYTSNYFIKKSVKKLEGFLQSYGTDASNCYQLLASAQSKNLYLDLICYRLLGKNKVRIGDTIDLIEKRNKTKYIKGNTEKIPIHFLSHSWILENFLIESSGKKLNIISRPSAIFAEFTFEQYRYFNDDLNIGVEKGDICIDSGACWGDSTLYFSSRAGSDGKVFAFEFIPGNIEILEKNLALNRGVSDNVNIVKRPLWSSSGIPVWYIDNGPASQVSFNPIKNADNKVTTYTIDELVQDNRLDKLNFIKMDIEGAEGSALEGAKNSIIRFKPKLAICIYHSLEDFTKIAQWINELKLGYKFYLKHATIHLEETVLFAI